MYPAELSAGVGASARTSASAAVAAADMLTMLLVDPEYNTACHFVQKLTTCGLSSCLWRMLSSPLQLNSEKQWHPHSGIGA